MPECDQSQTAGNHTNKIRDLNDALRTTLVGGEITLTRGVAMLDSDVIQAITVALQTYDDFTDDNDPYGEHDFGKMTVNGYELFFKIDYYDAYMKFHSPDAGADHHACRRILSRGKTYATLPGKAGSVPA